MFAKVSKKGQVTIPKLIREKNGDRYEFIHFNVRNVAIRNGVGPNQPSGGTRNIAEFAA